jgi:hypothetical protein
VTTHTDEIWITKDGRKIPVGEMSEEHVRNALRMVLRMRRHAAKKIIETLEPYEGDGQDFLNAQAYRDLANPNAFFPLLEGGVYGSKDLQAKYGRN